jgi:hypothetical protein
LLAGESIPIPPSLSRLCHSSFVQACKIATTLLLQLVVFAVEEVELEGVRFYIYSDFECRIRISKHIIHFISLVKNTIDF